MTIKNKKGPRKRGDSAQERKNEGQQARKKKEKKRGMLTREQ
jgi:hypothetical protein